MYFDKDFNLIIDINENIQACVKPITRKFFERHYKIFNSLAIRFNRQADEDQALLINQTALLDLKDVAGEEKSGEIIDEINRTTFISIACGEKGKKPVLLDIALEKKMIDLDEFNETLSLIIFFYSSLAYCSPEERTGIEIFSGLSVNTFNLIKLYRLSEIIRDIENRRDYRRESENLFTIVFNILTGERFDIIADIIQKIERNKNPYTSAEHFRQRYLMSLMGMFNM